MDSGMKGDASASTSAAPFAPLQPGGKVPKKRTRTGCMTCRKRKHKCGEERLGPPDHPSCLRCEQAQLECVWPTVDQLPQGRKPRPGKAASAPYPARSKQATFVDKASQDDSTLDLPPVPGPLAALDPALLSFDDLSNAGFWPENAIAGPSHSVLPGTSPIEADIDTSFDALLSGSAQLWDLDLPSDQDPSSSAPLSQLPDPFLAPQDVFSLDNLWLARSPPAHDASTPSALPPEFTQQFDPSIFAGMEQAIATRPSPSWITQIPRYSMPTPPLELLFKNPDELHLVQHFLTKIPLIFVGDDNSRSALTQRDTLPLSHRLQLGQQPRLSSFLPYLDIPQFLSTSRGNSTANDALSMSILSIAATHLSHLHHRNALDAIVSSADHGRVATALSNESRYAAIASTMVDASLALGHASVKLAQLTNATLAEKSTETTQLLSACALSTLTRCCLGGRGYEPSLNLAKEIVVTFGGPQRMLQALAVAVPSSSSSPSTSVSKARLRMLRSVLEDLLFWELVSCLSTGQPSDRFEAVDVPLKDWFFAYSPPSGSWIGVDTGEGDWETVETTFGTSRVLMELFARVNSACARARSQDGPSPDTLPEVAQLLVEVRIRAEDVLRSFPDLRQSPFPPYDPTVTIDEEEYARRIKYGKLATCQVDKDGKRMGGRLEIGDLTWLYTFEIMLRTEVYGESSESPDIHAVAKRILELVIESDRRQLVNLGFVWPLIIAGSIMSEESGRDQARLALQTLRSFYLFDFNSALDVLDEVWACRDAGDTKTIWREVTIRKGGLAII